MERTRVRFAVSVALLAAAAAASADDFLDDVDVQIRGNETVDGTLQPANERETFLVDVPRGARITASVKRTGKDALVPALDLLQGAASPTLVASGAPNSKGAKLKSFVVAASDLYRLRAAGNGQVGDYQFKVAIAPQTSWSQKPGADLAAGAETTFSFAAPARATLDATLAPAKRSSFVPRIVEIDGPGGFAFPVDGTGATPRRHVALGVALGDGGEYTVRVRNDGTDAGAWTISVHVKPARLEKAEIDIRDSDETGTKFAGGLPVFGRVIDSLGGLVDPAAVGNPLQGASIQVPPNTLGGPSVFLIQSSDDVPPNGAKKYPSGAAVKLLPEGTIFSPSVTVKIPYDPQSYDDPANEVSVTTQDVTTLQLEDVPPSELTVDTVADTVSFPTSHFSRFQGFSPRPRPVKGDFVQLEMGGRVNAAGGSATFSLSQFKGRVGPRSGNRFDRALNRRVIRWDPTAVSWDVVAPAQDVGVITVVDDENITLTDPVDGAVQYARGRNVDVLVRRAAPDVDGAAVSVLLRVAQGAPTLFNVAGDWNAFVFEASAQHFKDVRALDLFMGGQVTQLTFGLDAKVTARSSVKYGAIADDAAGIGRWKFNNSGGRGLPKDGSLAFPADGSNTVALTMPLGFRTNQATTVALYPVLRGEMLVGVADNSDLSVNIGPLERLVVLVRARTSALKDELVGDSVFTAFGLRAVDFVGPPPTQDFGFVEDAFTATHGADHVVTYSGRRDSYSRDALGAPSYASDPGFTATGRYSVADDGSYVAKTLPFSGAVTVRGNVFVASRFVTGELSFGFGVVKPPEQ